eukprot:Rmarinus@m.75
MANDVRGELQLDISSAENSPMSTPTTESFPSVQGSTSELSGACPRGSGAFTSDTGQASSEPGISFSMSDHNDSSSLSHSSANEARDLAAHPPVVSAPSVSRVVGSRALSTASGPRVRRLQGTSTSKRSSPRRLTSEETDELVSRLLARDDRETRTEYLLLLGVAAFCIVLILVVALSLESPSFARTVVRRIPLISSYLRQ